MVYLCGWWKGKRLVHKEESWYNSLVHKRLGIILWRMKKTEFNSRGGSDIVPPRKQPPTHAWSSGTGKVRQTAFVGWHVMGHGHVIGYSCLSSLHTIHTIYHTYICTYSATYIYIIHSCLVLYIYIYIYIYYTFIFSTVYSTVYIVLYCMLSHRTGTIRVRVTVRVRCAKWVPREKLFSEIHSRTPYVRRTRTSRGKAFLSRGCA
jgi:hypothetical protein